MLVRYSRCDLCSSQYQTPPTTARECGEEPAYRLYVVTTISMVDGSQTDRAQTATANFRFSSIGFQTPPGVDRSEASFALLSLLHKPLRRHCIRRAIPGGKLEMFRASVDRRVSQGRPDRPVVRQQRTHACTVDMADLTTSWEVRLTLVEDLFRRFRGKSNRQTDQFEPQDIWDCKAPENPPRLLWREVAQTQRS